MTGNRAKPPLRHDAASHLPFKIAVEARIALGHRQPGKGNFAVVPRGFSLHEPGEKFMHLYNILLMLFGDKQLAFGAFIVGENQPLLATIRKVGSMRLANIE